MGKHILLNRKNFHAAWVRAYQPQTEGSRRETKAHGCRLFE